MKALFADFGFTLTKWSATSPEILNEIPKHDRDPQARELCTQSFNPRTQDVMGLKWLPEKDLLTLHGGRDQRNTDLTKRSILSDIQAFFNPIGYTSSFILKGNLPGTQQN